MTGTAEAISTEHNDADIMFAQMMIPHHEQAITMADLALDPSAKASGQVRDFAKDIKDAQDPEIQTMEGWLEDWDATAPEQHHRHERVHDRTPFCVSSMKMSSSVAPPISIRTRPSQG